MKTEFITSRMDDGRIRALHFGFKEGTTNMALLDSIVDANFRIHKTDRVVIYPGGRRDRGYIVKSVEEELKIKSFLKMFYFAHFSILSLGYLLAFGWSKDLIYALGAPSAFLYKAIGIVVGVYFLVVGVPYWLLWRSYKKSFLSFVSVQDEVVLSGKNASHRYGIVGVGLIASGILILLGIMSLLVRHASIAN
jgi:hypothetical protein